jgi:hypothetical protein
MTVATIADWKPVVRNTLRGFFTAHLPSGMTLHDVALHTRDRVWWVSPASKPMLNSDGVVLRDDGGKIRYSAIVAFDDKTSRQRFNSLLITALQQAHPDIFTEAGIL